MNVIVVELVHLHRLIFNKVLGVEQGDDHVAARTLCDVEGVITGLSFVHAQNQLVGHWLRHMLLLLLDDVGAVLVRGGSHLQRAVKRRVVQLVNLNVLHCVISLVAESILWSSKKRHLRFRWSCGLDLRRFRH